MSDGDAVRGAVKVKPSKREPEALNRRAAKSGNQPKGPLSRPAIEGFRSTKLKAKQKWGAGL